TRFSRDWSSDVYSSDLMLTFSRALDAWGGSTITPLTEGSAKGTIRDWQNDLVDRLAELQNEDGSFRPIDDRWMESNPVLITAYRSEERRVGNACRSRWS